MKKFWSWKERQQWWHNNRTEYEKRTTGEKWHRGDQTRQKSNSIFSFPSLNPFTQVRVSFSIRFCQGWLLYIVFIDSVTEIEGVAELTISKLAKTSWVRVTTRARGGDKKAACLWQKSITDRHRFLTMHTNSWLVKTFSPQLLFLFANLNTAYLTQLTYTTAMKCIGCFLKRFSINVKKKCEKKWRWPCSRI